jgi:hypothetical protein
LCPQREADFQELWSWCSAISSQNPHFVFLTTYFSNCCLVYLEVLSKSPNSTACHKSSKLFEDAHLCKTQKKIRKQLTAFGRAISSAMLERKGGRKSDQEAHARGFKGNTVDAYECLLYYCKLKCICVLHIHAYIHNLWI